MRLHGIRKEIYLITCCHPRLNQRALQMRRSLDEVMDLLGCCQKGPGKSTSKKKSQKKN